jgi:hypothetical protein
MPYVDFPAGLLEASPARFVVFSWVKPESRGDATLNAVNCQTLPSDVRSGSNASKSRQCHGGFSAHRARLRVEGDHLGRRMVALI